MPEKGHTEEQIVATLRQVEAGARVAEVSRSAGISEATYCLCKRQDSGGGVSELRELRQLREENGRLKRRVADLSMYRQIQQEIVPKKEYGLVRVGRWRAGRRRPMGSASNMRPGWLQRVISTLRYRGRKGVDEVLRRRLRELAGTHVRRVCRGSGACRIRGTAQA